MNHEMVRLDAALESFSLSRGERAGVMASVLSDYIVPAEGEG